MNVSTPVIDRMFATKSTDATRLTEEELELLETAPYFEEFIIAKCGNLPAPDTWPTRTRRAKTPLKSQPREERERIAKLTRTYMDCHKEAHDDLAEGSFGRVLDIFEPLYGKACGEKRALD